jgi:WD40 repeat protein
MTSDGSLLAIGNLNEIEVWNLQSKKCFCLLRGHEARIDHLIISLDGKSIVSYASNDSIKIWST